MKPLKMPANRDAGVQEVQAMVDEPGTICVHCVLPRRGFLMFITELELRFFPPQTPLNEYFQIVKLEWHGQQWVSVIVPAAVSQQLDEIAANYDLKRVRAVPICWKVPPNVIVFAAVNEHKFDHEPPPGRIDWYPIRGENTYTLESVANGGGPQEFSDPEEIRLEHLRMCELRVSLGFPLPSKESGN